MKWTPLDRDYGKEASARSLERSEIKSRALVEDHPFGFAFASSSVSDDEMEDAGVKENAQRTPAASSKDKNQI